MMGGKFDILFILFFVFLFGSCNNKGKSNLNELNESFGVQSTLDDDVVVTKEEDPDVYSVIMINLDSDSQPDSVILKDKTNPGLFKTIIIKFSTGSSFTQKTAVAWDKIEKPLLEKYPNEINSDLLISKKDKTGTLLIFFGYAVECCPRNLTIIKVANNRASTVFDRGFQLIDIRDADSNQLFELLGRDTFIKTYEQNMKINADIGTYSPYLIYTLKEKYEINPKLSQEYNVKNYVFEGLKATETVKVAYPFDKSRPYLVDKKQ